MKRLNVILFCCLVVVPLWGGYARCEEAGRDVRLSEGAFASVLTCGPGDEFYECFGHSALRICDTAARIDVVFNYGIFSFDEPMFYLKFARGRLKYQLAVESFEGFMSEYDYYGRGVWEQRLLLTKEELERLFAMLLENAKPENKYYSYDFFRDNCATRVDDMITAALGEGRGIVEEGKRGELTYRDLLYKYNETMPWWQLGVDILLGARCDQRVDTKQMRYMPLEMMAQYDMLLLADGSPLCEGRRELLVESRRPTPKGISPTLVMWIVLAAVGGLSLYGDRKGWKLYWLDGILLGLAGLLGVLLLFLWFGCDHWCTKWNMNLLWANPLLLWPLVRLRRASKWDCLPMVFILLILIVGWPFWPQHINGAVLPIVLTILARLTVRVKRST